MAEPQQQENQPTRLVKESFISKYLLCCFSVKHKYPKSYIRSSSQSSTQAKSKVPKIKPKATKVFDVNDQQTEFQAMIFRQIKMPSMPESPAPLTKSHMYALQNNEGVKALQVESESLLDFRLDQDPGVSSTFSIPYFDYNGMMNNRYYARTKQALKTSN